MILDSSVAVKWLVPEDDSDAAAALVGQSDLFVPTLFHAEVANALWKKSLRGEIVLDEVADQLGNLPLLVTTVDEKALIPRAFAISVALRHPIYDCIYIALAEAREDRLVSADERLAAAVQGTEWSERVRKVSE